MSLPTTINFFSTLHGFLLVTDVSGTFFVQQYTETENCRTILEYEAQYDSCGAAEEAFENLAFNLGEKRE